MTKRKSVPVTPALTLAQVEILANSYADSCTSLRGLQAEIQSATAKLDAELEEVRKRHASELARLATRHSALALAANEKLTQLQGWAQAQRAVHFVTKKSLELARLVLGFSTNPHKVEALDGWSLVKAALALAKTRWGKKFTRPELLKNPIIAARNEISAERLASCGLQIVQEEQFFVTLKDETQSQALAA